MQDQPDDELEMCERTSYETLTRINITKSPVALTIIYIAEAQV